MQCGTDPRENREKALSRIDEAAAAGAQIVSTQELFCSQYFCQSEDHDNFALAETIPGPSTDALSRVAASRRIAIVASLFEKRAPGLYHNTAVVIDADGKLAGCYRKMHIPDDPSTTRNLLHSRRPRLRRHQYPLRPCGTLVCWDQWFPEAARLTALRGAEIIFYPTAIGWHPSEKAEYGEAQLPPGRPFSGAIRLPMGSTIAAANRVGHEGETGAGIEFWGRASSVTPPERLSREAVWRMKRSSMQSAISAGSTFNALTGPS
jgi:N-carbamoylputrescine amidase